MSHARTIWRRRRKEFRSSLSTERAKWANTFAHFQASAERKLCLQDQYTFWIFYFAPLLKYLKRSSNPYGKCPALSFVSANKIYALTGAILYSRRRKEFLSLQKRYRLSIFCLLHDKISGNLFESFRTLAKYSRKKLHVFVFLFLILRRRKDSNLRGLLDPTSLAVRRFRPLSHVSKIHPEFWRRGWVERNFRPPIAS